jgi:hypothetical protein
MISLFFILIISFIIIKREDWENLREFRKAPFKKRYLKIIILYEILENELKTEILKLNSQNKNC